MTKLLLITFLLISNLCFSQLKSVIINSETKEKIPFVNIWVENENIGTTSNENGEFRLEVNDQKNIVFSAIGFETKKISSKLIKNVVELNPKLVQLDEVTISTKKLSRETTIGNFRRSKIHSYFACGAEPWISARFFEYKEEYDKTTYLNKIKILTRSNLKGSKFNIRLYDINDDGKPENYLYDQNIIGIAKKGKKITEIDVSDLNIKFPKNGFFIAIEWLIIEKNKFEYKYRTKESKKKLTGISYEPAIGTVPSESNKNSWIFRKGKWIKIWKNSNKALRRYRDKYNLLAIELILTN
ncbi:carboxypeptidase-like regulatory domain-containing protein [Flavobacteriaceae bacterium 14752]|uniref:carboxypeptidase-like regulatory domain-containing protein n=1 Tax=Mesohalobacter salilacus TaxID=2491711 RepID=UPI000F6407AC|nr:carboxypeptidase-like regulatory domain-containing protein [Flavobacteriaceae bacterium 14752]